MDESYEDIRDETLVALVANGDGGAFSVLVGRHAMRFRAVALRMVSDAALAEEMVQEAFIKLWTRPSSFDGAKAKFTTWFHRVVVNRCLDELRRRKPDALPEGYDAPDNAPGTEAALVQEAGVSLLMKALAKLPDRQSEALKLSYLDGYSNQEAADIMDLNIKAFESLLVRARAKMRDELKAEKADLLTAFA